MEKNKKSVGVLALGRLGVCFSLLCADSGYSVYGYDISEERMKQIKDKTLKTSEPQVEELLAKNTINACKSITEVFDNTDIVFIFVVTPSLPNGEYSHESIDNIVKEIESSQITYKTLCIVSTCMPFYPQEVQDKLNHLGIHVLYMPSLIAQGTICNNIKNADLVFLGTNKDVTPQIFEIYRDIMSKEPNFKRMSLTGVGVAKIALNCFLTMKISFSNTIGEIAINSNIEEDVDKILDAIGSDSRVGNKYLKYGFGYGGTCLVRDERALGIHATKIGLTDSFQKEIDKVNDRHLFFQKEYLIKKNPYKNNPFIFSYITFKDKTDIIEQSQPLKLCLELLKEGYTVYIPFEQLSLDLPKELRDFEEKGWLKAGYNGMMTSYLSGDKAGKTEVLKGYQVN